jgi:hypothetical protein
VLQLPPSRLCGGGLPQRHSLPQVPSWGATVLVPTSTLDLLTSAALRNGTNDFRSSQCCTLVPTMSPWDSLASCRPWGRKGCRSILRCCSSHVVAQASGWPPKPCQWGRMGLPRKGVTRPRHPGTRRHPCLRDPCLVMSSRLLLIHHHLPTPPPHPRSPVALGAPSRRPWFEKRIIPRSTAIDAAEAQLDNALFAVVGCPLVGRTQPGPGNSSQALPGSGRDGVSPALPCRSFPPCFSRAR